MRWISDALLSPSTRPFAATVPVLRPRPSDLPTRSIHPVYFCNPILHSRDLPNSTVNNASAVESFLTESTDTVSTVVGHPLQPQSTFPLPWPKPTTTTASPLSELCMEGGWIMIPLAILSIICIYIYLWERWLTIRRASRQDRTFMDRIRDYIHQGEPESAIRLCELHRHPQAVPDRQGASAVRPPHERCPRGYRKYRQSGDRIARQGAFHGSPPLPQELRCSASSGTVIAGMVEGILAGLASAGSSANIAILAGEVSMGGSLTTVAGI